MQSNDSRKGTICEDEEEEWEDEDDEDEDEEVLE